MVKPIGRASDQRFQPPKYFPFGLRPDHPIHFPASFEHQQRGNAANIEPRRRHGILVHVQFHHTHAPGHFRCQLVDQRRNHAARPAPGGPHINQNGQRRVLHIRCKGRISHMKRFAGGRGESGFTFSANRTESCFEFLCRYTISGAALRASNHLHVRHNFTMPYALTSAGKEIDCVGFHNTRNSVRTLPVIPR